MTTLDVVRQRYRHFAETECYGYSPLYERLSLGVAADDSVTRFIADQSAIQPNLFFAAVQLVAGLDGMPSETRQLADLVGARGTDIAEVMASRHTQTNEVGRCAVLVPAFPVGPLAIIEVGASAGLCLLLDQFFYDYGVARIGHASSPVRMTCAVDSAQPLSPRLPHVAWRRGLDVAPIDVGDDAAVQWLLACVWADHSHRRQRLAAAIALARANPPVVMAGDLIDDLERIVRDAPADASLVVFHSAVLAYLGQDRRILFEEVLADLSKKRDVVWISNEAPGVVSRFDCPSSREAELRFVVGRSTFRAGAAAVDEVLAVAHPHGGAMTWLKG